MCMCKKCFTISSVLFLAAGVLFLLQDLKIWNFWGLNWYTVLFLIVGVAGFATTKCKDCCVCEGMKMGKKGKK